MMMNMIRVGKQIATRRRECGFTQESLAEKLNVSTQAVSKWENGKNLPETSLLPSLAQALETSIDSILTQNSIQILSAVYGDGIEYINVTNRLSRLIQNDQLEIQIHATTLACQFTHNRPKFLLVKFETEGGIFYTYAKEFDQLIISKDTKGYEACNELKIIDAFYGNQKEYVQVMNKIEHYHFFDWKCYEANHEVFPSNPLSDEKDYLTFIYMNQKGIHFVTCEEGESIALAEFHDGFYRKKIDGKYLIPNVPMLPEFGKGHECSWAAALTAALQAMNIKTDYEEVMGVSGACYRLAFCSPKWDYSSVDGLIAYDYATPAYKAYGYRLSVENHVEKEKRAEVRKKIRNQLSNNIPVLGINLRVAPEWGVICGYNEEDGEMYCRTKYDSEILKSEEYKECKHNAYDYLNVDQWPFLISFFEERILPPTARENLMNSLKIFLDCNKQEQCREYALGEKAYKVWANELTDEKWYEQHSKQDWERRLSVNQFCVLALYDARKSAYLYLKRAAHLLLGKEEAMQKLVECFEHIMLIAEQMHKAINFGEYVDAKHVEQLWTKALREKQAKQLLEMNQIEHEAIKLAECILSE